MRSGAVSSCQPVSPRHFFSKNSFFRKHKTEDFFEFHSNPEMPNRNETPKRNPHNNLCAASIHSRKQKDDSDEAYDDFQKQCANR